MLFLVGLATGLGALKGGAFPVVRDNFFVAYPDAVGSTIETLPSNEDHCGVCHYSFSGGGERNPYGIAVGGTNLTSAAILGLGGLDSDGDGFTNDEEINDLVSFLNTPTFPGLREDNVGLTSNVALAEIIDFLTPALVITHDERFDGDLSDDRLNPTPFVLGLGDNTIRATQQGDALGRDLDYATITIPAGRALTALVVDEFVADPGNLAFLGIQAGTTFSVDAGSATAGDLLGGVVYGEGDVDADVLPAAGALAGAIGFTPPLAAGDYTVWWNQTGPPSTAALAFVVPEPGERFQLGAIVGALVLVGVRASRRSAKTG